MTTQRAVIAGLQISTLALGLALPAFGQQPAREPAKTDRTAAGHLSFRVHCASCHGEGGKGDGPMAKVLKIQPADLTRLALSHQGRFPREEVYNAIDGRREVTGHGPTGMPVWGATFQDRGQDRPQEREVREKILDLLTYLESIQAAH